MDVLKEDTFYMVKAKYQSPILVVEDSILTIGNIKTALPKQFCFFLGLPIFEYGYKS